jgi:hypothetical protein
MILPIRIIDPPAPIGILLLAPAGKALLRVFLRPVGIFALVLTTRAARPHAISVLLVSHVIVPFVSNVL